VGAGGGGHGWQGGREAGGRGGRGAGREGGQRREEEAAVACAQVLHNRQQVRVLVTHMLIMKRRKYPLLTYPPPP
jgi:hypothetical protein